MTNYDFIKTLSEEKMAKIFAKLSLGDAAKEEDWLEWMKQPYSTEQWMHILH